MGIRIALGINQFSAFDFTSKDGWLARMSSIWTDLSDFRPSFQCVIEMEKFDHKVKGLTHAFRRFFDYFQSIRTNPKDGRLTQITKFWTAMSNFRPSFISVLAVEKFDQKVKGLTHGFWRFSDAFQSVQTISKDARLAEMS